MRSELGRVLLTADGVGGVWPYAMELAQALIARGVAVDIAAMGPPLSDLQRREALAAGAGLFEWHGRLEWMDRPWDDIERAGEWLLDLERTCQPDLVHLNGYCHADLPWNAPAVVVGHSCVRSWWQAVHGEDPPPHWDEYTARVRSGLAAASAVVAPSATMARALEDEYGPLGAIRVVPNGRTPRGADAARAPVVFSAGRIWDEAKNIAAVCASAPQVSWPVFVAGDNRHPDGRISQSTGVEYLGTLTAGEMREWLGRASIYAFPARYEPFGLSVLEAAQAGCALVLGDIRSLRENWDGAAVFVPPDNRRALASAIQQLIDSPTMLRHYASRAAARAGAFTVDRMRDGYLDVYACALASRGDALERPALVARGA